MELVLSGFMNHTGRSGSPSELEESRTVAIYSKFHQRTEWFEQRQDAYMALGLICRKRPFKDYNP